MLFPVRRHCAFLAFFPFSFSLSKKNSSYRTTTTSMRCDGMSYECLCFLVSCNKFHLIFAHKTRRILVCIIFFSVMLRIWEMFTRFNVHAHCRLFAYAFLRPREGKLFSLFFFYIFTWLLNVCSAMEGAWRIVLERENLALSLLLFYREFIKHEICNKPTFFHSLVIFAQNFFLRLYPWIARITFFLNLSF